MPIVEGMGDVISLAEYRARSAGLPVALERLDRIVKRLEPLVRHRSGRLAARIEAELLAIASDVSAGRPYLAARRAERLADRLEHPAALG
jgi:hypothetical protein